MGWIIHVLEAQMRMYHLLVKEDLSNHIACKILTPKDLNPFTHGAFIGIKLNSHISQCPMQNTISIPGSKDEVVLGFFSALKPTWNCGTHKLQWVQGR